MELDSQTVPQRVRAGNPSASVETSIPVTRAPGCSSAIDSAIAPLPVPTSRTSALADRRQAREAALDDDLGLGPWDEHTPIDVQGEPPEPPLTEHVRKRLALLAARDESLERLLLVAARSSAAARAPTS